MKRILILLTLMVMAAPAVCSAWSDSFGPMSPEDMKKAFCRGVPEFQVISWHDDWSGFQTEVRPVQPKLFPEPEQVMQIRVEAGTELAQVFEVGSSVTHIPYPEYSVEKAGPSVWVTPAGTSTFGGSEMIRHGGGMYLQVH